MLVLVTLTYEILLLGLWTYISSKIRTHEWVETCYDWIYSKDKSKVFWGT